MLSADPAPAELLARLAAHDERMEKFLGAHPVIIRIEGHELDSDGKVTHTSKAELKQTRPNGKLHTEVINASLDGEDETEKEKGRAGKRDDKNERTESPFAPRNQVRYKFTMMTADRIAFGPKDDPATDILVGQAQVDPATGEVVKLWLKPSKNPSFVDKLDMQIEYDAHTSAGRMISKFSFQGAGGFLMFKKAGDATMTFHYGDAK